MHAIKVEDLSKKYFLDHRKREPSADLRDVLSEKLSNLGRTLKHLAGQSSATQDFSREEFWALKDVSFDIKQGERVGIIGRNGAGKSTLLKILSRITSPTGGKVSIKGRVASLLEVGTGFHPELTGRENIYLNGAILGMSRVEIRTKFDEIVAFAEVEKFLDIPVKRYSSGMYVRLAFAVAAHLDPEILLIDEVLAVGDALFQKKCLGKMREIGRKGRTILFVSHNMTAIRSICPKVIVLEHGNVIYNGKAEDSITHYLGAGDQESFENIWNSPESAPGNEHIRLRRVAIISADGVPSERISVRTPINIEIEFWNQKPGACISISMHIVTLEEAVVFATTTWQEPEWNGKKFNSGLYKSVCRLTGDLLNVGPYLVRIYFLENSKNLLAKIDNAITFQLLDSTHDRDDWHGKWEGVVRPNLKWTTELIEPQHSLLCENSVLT